MNFEEKLKKCKELLKDGESLRYISYGIGVSIKTIKKYLNLIYDQNNSRWILDGSPCPCTSKQWIHENAMILKKY